MKKKILFISPTGTLDNGAEISIVNLMEYLVQTGHQLINAIPDYHVAVQQDYISSLAALGVETIALPSVKWMRQVACQVVLSLELALIKKIPQRSERY